MPKHSRESTSTAVARRILELKQPSENDVHFARRIGLSPQVLSNYRARLHGASLDAVVAVTRATEVDVLWLLTGRSRSMQVAPEESDPFTSGANVALDQVSAYLERLRQVLARAPLEPGTKKPAAR